MDEKRITVDPLLPEILRALKLSGESKSRFGYEVGGDPSLVRRMVMGRQLKSPDLRKRVEQRVALLLGPGDVSAIFD